MGAGNDRGQRPHAGSPTVDEHVCPEEKPHTAARGRNSIAGGQEAVGALVAALRSTLDKHGDQIKAIFTGCDSLTPY